MAFVQRMYSQDEYNALLSKYDSSKTEIAALKKKIANLEENLFLMSNPDYYKELLRRIESVENGTAELITFTAEEFEQYSNELMWHEG